MIKIIIPILISIIQIFVLLIIHESLNHFYPIQHRSIGFGLTILLTENIFMLCIPAFNFYLEFFKRNTYWIGFFLLILTCIFPLEVFDVRPLRSLFLILLALCGFSSSLALLKWRMRISQKTETSF